MPYFENEKACMRYFKKFKINNINMILPIRRIGDPNYVL